MHPLFSHAQNSNQAQSSNGAHPSLHQSMLSNPAMFPNRQPMPNFNQNINNNGAGGWPASPAMLPPTHNVAMMPPPHNVAMMLQNNQMGLLPQLAPQLFALNPAAQQFAALQLQAQLQQNFNVFASLQNSNLQPNFNLGLGGVPTGNANLQNLMIQGNQIGGPGANPCLGTSNPGSSVMPNAALGGQNSSFGKGAMHGDARQNKFNRGANYKKFHPTNSGSPSGSPVKRFRDMKHDKQERNRFQNHRFQNPQPARNMKNGAGESARTGGKGNDYWKGTPSEKTPSVVRKRSYLYNETEIRQWIEARKKNYPTRGKIELSQSVSSSKDVDEEAKLRKQQMKDVLSKQAELGVEVAEVPPSYLSETENETCRHKRNRRGMHGRRPNMRSDGRPNIRNDGRPNMRNDGRPNMRNDGRPNMRSDASASSSQSVIKREPTLLEKLLSKEIRGDNYRILQACRFMTLNNFFNDFPDKPLVYPDVSVKDEGCDSKIVTYEAQEGTNSKKAGARKNNEAKDSQELHEVNKVREVADEDEDKERYEESEEGELTE